MPAGRDEAGSRCVQPAILEEQMEKDFKHADSSGYIPDMALIGRRYKHVGSGKTYFIGGFSWDADRQRWQIGYKNAGGPVVFTRLPEEFFSRHNGRPLFVPVQ